jgi:hypothetical protein
MSFRSSEACKIIKNVWSICIPFQHTGPILFARRRQELLNIERRGGFGSKIFLIILILNETLEKIFERRRKKVEHYVMGNLLALILD